MTQQPYPSVNLNGTSADVLMKQLRNALDALRTAYDALLDASPHGRDYQIGPWSWSDAIGAHNRRLQKLDEIKRELQAQLDEVMRQRDEREARRAR